MSLLLEALKKAEKAKQDAQQRAQGGGAPDARADEEAPAAAEGRHVRTRDELPDISQPLEILSEDLRDDPPTRGAQPGLALEDDTPKPAREGERRRKASAAPAPEVQAAERKTAKRVFEAKFKEPNPRLPFYIALSVLGVLSAGTVTYFWMQLRPPAALVNVNPPRPTGEPAVAAAAAPQPAAAATQPLSVQIPGLPGGAAPAAPAVAAAPAAPAVPAARTAPAAAAASPAAVAPQAARPPAPPTAAAAQPAAKASRDARSAVAVSRQALQVNPRLETAYAAYNAGDLGVARSNYELALREDPASRDALLGLAAVEMLARRFDAADAHYQRLLQADPRDPHAQAGLLALRSQSVDPVQAESRLKSLLAADPESNVLYFTLGNQYSRQQRWAEAQQAYFKAYTADPENADFAFNLAVSLDHLRQRRLALEYYERALALAAKRPASFDQPAARARAQQLAR